MADYLLLPSATYREPSPSQGRGKGRLLNTIIEEENEDMSPRQAAHQRGRRNLNGSGLKIEQWLSPLSDHFPTPRGIHFMAAPVLPSSPSAVSADESNSPQSSSSNPSTNLFNRSSFMTDATEFDDIYDVSEDEEERRNRQADQTTSASRRSSGASFEESRKSLAKLVIPTGRAAMNESWSGHPDYKALLTSPVAPTPTANVPMSPAMMSFMQVQQSLEVPTISAPPSLDGSYTSDQLAQMSAPPTPVIGGQDDNDQGWTGVRLQPSALATLQALSAVSSPSSDVDFAEQVIEVPSPADNTTVANTQPLPQPPPAPESPSGEMAEIRRRPTLVLAELQNRSRNQGSHDRPQGQRPVEMSTIANRPLRLLTSVSRTSMTMSPTQARSLAGLTKLDIPSPGGFFSCLSPRSRHTWHMPGQTPVDKTPDPPTTGTAERFYNLPWSNDPVPPVPAPTPVPAPAPADRPLHLASGEFSTDPVEQVVLVKGKGKERDSNGPLTATPALTATPVPSNGEPVTARLVPPTPAQTSSATLADSTPSPIEDVVATEIVVNYDPVYARKQQEIALSHLDRTESWLMAQRVYLKGVAPTDELPDEIYAEVEEAKAVEPEIPPTPPPKDDEPEKEKEKPAECALVRKKTVRFSEPVKSPSVPRSLPSKLIHQESAYYRAFTDFMVRSQHADIFVSRLPRFEALQAQRISLREAHRNQLLGKYQLSVVPQSAKKRMSANVARGDDVLTDDPAKLRADKEADALSQMSMTTWQVAAWKLLNGGRLIAAPVHKRLARLSRMAPGPGGVTRDRARILDLGGQATCDWAWHAALAYPNTKIYTVTTKAIRQLSNSNIRGPPNHRQVAVERLTKLPFADNQFDLVRAADLHAILKYVGENGEDEWESCLHEVLRVLKPGGYLEFTVLDADLVNAGKLGNAKGVEMGFSLKTLGYDPAPSRLFLGRLQRAGFEGTKRAWLCLPVGPRPQQLAASPPSLDRDGNPVPTLALEAMVSGSADHVAAVSGLAAGWAWERWMLRAEMETAAGELRLADTVNPGEAMREAGKSLEAVHAVVEEGRRCGAGFRVLRGHARKPRAASVGYGLINMVLDTGALP